MRISTPDIARLAARTVLLIGALILAASCTKKLPPIIFPQSLYPAETYPSHTEIAGLVMAVIPYVPGVGMNIDPKRPLPEPDEVPLNVLEAGVLPIRVILTNHGDGELVVNPSQFLCLSSSAPYKSYPPQRAMGLVVESDVFKKALKGTSIGPLLKSIFGGEMIINAASSSVGGLFRGGLIGGASGGASSATNTAMARANQYENALTKLLYNQAESAAIKPQTLLPGFTTDGVLYCPSTIDIQAIRVTIYDRTNEEPVSLLCPFKPPAGGNEAGKPADGS
jgi:hypothetical protein